MPRKAMPAAVIVPAAFADVVDRLPPGLRSILDRELAAGNGIEEAGGGHPAAPAGLWLRLKEAFGPVPEPLPDDVGHYRRNGSTWCSEYSDSKRHFFLLDPPVAPVDPPSPAEFYRQREEAQAKAELERQAAAERDLKRTRRAAARRSRRWLAGLDATDESWRHEPDPHPGDYAVDFDWRGEMATYREPGRSASLFCAWHGGPVGHVSHIAGYWEFPDRASKPMSADDRAVVLHRVVREARRQQGFILVPDGL